MISKYGTYLIIALLAGYVAFHLITKMQSASEGEQAPDFETEQTDGTSFQLSGLKGNYVLLTFWGSWCGSCYRDHPKLVKLYKRYHDQRFTDAENFEIVSVALEKKAGQWQRVAERFGFNWEHQIVDISKFVMLSRIARKYGVTEIPAKFLIHPDGSLKALSSLEEAEQILAAGLE